MSPAVSKTWSWDQCGSVAIDGGELAAEDEFGSSGAGGVDHLERHTRQSRFRLDARARSNNCDQGGRCIHLGF